MGPRMRPLLHTMWIVAHILHRSVDGQNSPTHNCPETVYTGTHTTCWCNASFTSTAVPTSVMWTHLDSGTVVSTGATSAILTINASRTAICGEGWSLDEGRLTCLKYFTEPLTWGNAVQACQNLDSHLVQIPDGSAQAFIDGLLSEKASATDEVFIGLRERRKFVNTNNQEMDPEYWALGDPSNFNGDEDCVVITSIQTMSSRPMKDYSCSKTLNFICQRPFNGYCDNGFDYNLYDGTCYRVIISETRTWSEAQQFCENLGGELASMKSVNSVELYYYLTTPSPYNDHNPYYIGYSQQKEFRWDRQELPLSSSSYANWAAGSPGFGSHIPVCVSLSLTNGWRWITSACREPNPFICQKPAALLGSGPRKYTCWSEYDIASSVAYYSYSVVDAPPTTDAPTTTTTSTTATTTATSSTDLTTASTRISQTTTHTATDSQTQTLSTPVPTIIPSTQYTTRVTTQPPTTTTTVTNKTVCICSNEFKLVRNMTRDELLGMTSDLQKDLAVKVSELSATKRKKICAPDERLLPRVAAIVSVSILTSCFICLVIGDIVRCINYLHSEN